MKKQLGVILYMILILFIFGCAQTQPREDKTYQISPSQVINKVTVISPDSFKWLLELSEKDLDKAIEILNKTGGVVMSMGAWGIKVEGIRAERSTTSEATSDMKMDATLAKPK